MANDGFGSSNGRRAPEGTRHIGSTTLGLGRGGAPPPRPRNVSEWLNKGSPRDYSPPDLKPLTAFGLNFTETDTDGNTIPRTPTAAEVCEAIARRDLAARERARAAGITSGEPTLA